MCVRVYVVTIIIKWGLEITEHQTMVCVVKPAGEVLFKSLQLNINTGRK